MLGKPPVGAEMDQVGEGGRVHNFQKHVVGLFLWLHGVRFQNIHKGSKGRVPIRGNTGGGKGGTIRAQEIKMVKGALQFV
jgi:hypothetical protein